MIRRPQHRSRQRGQATVEWLYVIPILLILLLGSLQFVFIYQAKQTLNYATFVATRAGALNQGDMGAIREGLVAGLAPLFVHAETQKALKDARTVAKAELGDSKLALITIVNPSEAVANAFGGTIPNDNLMYRPIDVDNGVNVQDANILKVRVTYCVRLFVPLVNRMIYAFTVSPPATPDKMDSSYGGEKVAAPEILKATTGTGSGLCISPDDPYPYRIPVTSEAVVRMQSAFSNPSGSWTAP
jgi:hypothetical protein